MKRFVLVHHGFEKPTPEVMQAWGAWFQSIADRTVENIGFGAAKEVSASGVADLPWGPDSFTGCTILKAADLDEAVKVAQECPFVTGVRVYEVREG
jgi:hypothetical protein